MSKEDAYAAAERKDFDEKASQDAEPEAVPFKTKPWWKFGGKDYSFVPIDSGYSKTAASSNSNLDAVQDMGRHVYETDAAKDIYKPIEGYEGSHRFDPSFKWTPEEEKSLVKTVTSASFA